MSCKCDGIVRYDSVKKKLLYRSGCDWLDVPASALSGEGARPDIDFGDEELPTPPDGDQSQNYACREAYEVMRHLQGLAYYGYLQSANDYTEFVRLTGTPTGIAFKGQISRYFYDQARKPENAQAFDELTGDDTQRDIFVCQLAEALTKAPGWSTDDDVALYDLIQGMASIPKLIYTYALHLTNTNELNDIATAAAYDESVPCPCGAASGSIAPDNPSLATWSVEADLTAGQKGFTRGATIGGEQWGEYVAGEGFKGQLFDYDNVEDVTNFVYIISPSFTSRRVVRIDYQMTDVVEGLFQLQEGTPNNDIEVFSVRVMPSGYDMVIGENGNGWHSVSLNVTTNQFALFGWAAYAESSGPTTNTSNQVIAKVRVHGTGTKPTEFESAGWVDIT